MTPSGERSPPDDGKLVAALLRGDEQAFQTFFESYFPRLYQFALRRLSGDAEATRHAVQATLTKAIRNLPTYRREATLFNWLCQILDEQRLGSDPIDRTTHADVAPLQQQQSRSAAKARWLSWLMCIACCIFGNDMPSNSSAECAAARLAAFA
jgi:hypothetical protein